MAATRARVAAVVMVMAAALGVKKRRSAFRRYERRDARMIFFTYFCCTSIKE